VKKLSLVVPNPLKKKKINKQKLGNKSNICYAMHITTYKGKNRKSKSRMK
jgi:hypothetical protein